MCSRKQSISRHAWSTKYPNVSGDYLQMYAPVLILYGLVHFHLPDFQVCVLVWINFCQLTTWYLGEGKVIFRTWQGPEQTRLNQNVLAKQTVVSSETEFCTTCDTTEHLIIKWHYGRFLCLWSCNLQLYTLTSLYCLREDSSLYYLPISLGRLCLYLVLTFKISALPLRHTYICTLNWALLHCFGRHVGWI